MGKGTSEEEDVGTRAHPPSPSYVVRRDVTSTTSSQIAGQYMAPDFPGKFISRACTVRHASATRIYGAEYAVVVRGVHPSVTNRYSIEPAEWTELVFGGGEAHEEIRVSPLISVHLLSRSFIETLSQPIFKLFHRRTSTFSSQVLSV